MTYISLFLSRILSHSKSWLSKSWLSKSWLSKSWLNNDIIETFTYYFIFSFNCIGNTAPY